MGGSFQLYNAIILNDLLMKTGSMEDDLITQSLRHKQMNLQVYSSLRPFTLRLKPCCSIKNKGFFKKPLETKALKAKRTRSSSKEIEDKKGSVRALCFEGVDHGEIIGALSSVVRDSQPIHEEILKFISELGSSSTLSDLQLDNCRLRI